MIGNYLMLFFGLAFIGYVVYLLYRNYLTKRFLKTTGIVLSSEVKTDYGDDGVSYEPLIRYEYKIGEEIFQSSAYSISPIRSKRNAQKIVAEHIPGNPVEVFYNPKKPGDSVLFFGIGFWNYLGILLFASLIIIAIVEIFFF